MPAPPVLLSIVLISHSILEVGRASLSAAVLLRLDFESGSGGAFRSAAVLLRLDFESGSGGAFRSAAVSFAPGF